MKNILTALILMIGLTGISTTALSQDNKAKEEATKVIVYYFHNTHRCITCNAIEKHTKDVLENSFTDELEDKTIVFKTFNAEAKENKELVEKYEIWGSSLVIVTIKDGKESIENLTQFAFANARKKSDKFKLKVQETLIEKLK